MLWVKRWAEGRDAHHVQARPQGRLRLADGHARLLWLQVHRSTLRLNTIPSEAICYELSCRLAVLAA